MATPKATFGLTLAGTVNGLTQTNLPTSAVEIGQRQSNGLEPQRPVTVWIAPMIQRSTIVASPNNATFVPFSQSTSGSLSYDSKTGTFQPAKP